MVTLHIISYLKIEDEIRVKNLTWQNEEVRETFDKRITERLFVKDDVCSLPDLNDRNLNLLFHQSS